MAYQPLDSNRHEVRLLNITADESAMITCTLKTVSLLDKPSFKALSYHWGSEKAPQHLLLEGEETEITVNLDQAIRQLRQENHGPIYIDALCINHNDNSEKSGQVILMGEIYSTATEVIAWLGPAERQSDGAMDLMKGFGKYARNSELRPGIAGESLSSDDCSADNEVLWHAVDGLLGRPYWQRTWILQELLLAKTVLFRCGTKSVTFDDIDGTYSVIIRRTNSPNMRELTLKEAHLQSVFLLLSLRDLDGMNKSGRPLTSILAESNGQLVSDFRDKVYGLLGMASDASTLVPLPSYDITAGELYVQLTRSLIASSKRMAYIRFKSPFGESSLKIPSWAMDLSTPCFDASDGLSQDILQIPLNWKAGTEAHTQFSDSGYGKDTVLSVWGMVMGTVDGIGSVLPIYRSFTSSKYVITEPHSTTNRYGSENATLVAILEALLGTGSLKSNPSLKHSSQLECHKFSFQALMKPEHGGLLASIPELEAWLDMNKQFVFGGRSLSSWSTIETENAPVSRQVPRLEPHGDGVSETPNANTASTYGKRLQSVDVTPSSLASSSFAKQVSTSSQNHGDGVSETPNENAGSTYGERLQSVDVTPSSLASSSFAKQVSTSSQNVFFSLIRAHRNASVGLDNRFPVAAALRSGSKNSSLTDKDLEKIELTVKALLANLIKYRRIFTTSAGSIGMAHPQVRKDDMICYMQGSAPTLVILREQPPPPNQDPGVAAETGESSTSGGASADKRIEHKVCRVIGEATLAGFQNPEFVPQGLKWQLFALV